MAVAWLFEFHLLDLYGECRYYDSAESVLGAEALKSKAGTSSCGHVTRFDVMFIHLDGPLNAAFTVNPLSTSLNDCVSYSSSLQVLYMAEHQALRWEILTAWPSKHGSKELTQRLKYNKP